MYGTCSDSPANSGEEVYPCSTAASEVLQVLVRFIGVSDGLTARCGVYHASPDAIEPVPHETARVARATFPTGNRDRRLADARETLFTDAAFLTLFPTHGQPALPTWRLYGP